MCCMWWHGYFSSKQKLKKKNKSQCPICWVYSTQPPADNSPGYWCIGVWDHVLFLVSFLLSMFLVSLIFGIGVTDHLFVSCFLFLAVSKFMFQCFAFRVSCLLLLCLLGRSARESPRPEAVKNGTPAEVSWAFWRLLAVSGTDSVDFDWFQEPSTNHQNLDSFLKTKESNSLTRESAPKAYFGSKLIRRTPSGARRVKDDALWAWTSPRRVWVRCIAPYYYTFPFMTRFISFLFI